MPLTLITSDRFADHLTPPGHPERVERAEVMQVIAAEFRQGGGDVLEPTPATDEQILRVHDADYLTQLRETSGRAVALDPDTFTSPETFTVARLASGAAVMAVDRVLDGPEGSRALALVRPPGHHAERGRAMGFCFFNNIAVAAAHARARGLARVAIVDYDVHHGNGTQHAFDDDPSVLFISSHQFPYYPGTGAAEEVGSGAGEGFTVNLPLEAGATDADYELVYSRIAFPVLEQFRPELILVSAGFDAYVDDPLGGMRVSAGQFERLTRGIGAMADRVCQGRVVAISEGGYELQGLAACFRAAIRGLDGRPVTDSGARPEGSTARSEACLAAVRPNLAQYWTL